MRYEVGLANRIGNRASNQDRFGVAETDEGVLLILADGMGGIAQGELAAQTLVDTAREVYLAAEQPIREPARLFEAIIYRAHDALVAVGGERRYPGTTGVLCLVQKGEAHWAHVGDSRLYLFRDRRVFFRTRDHSYVEELFRQGLIDSEERARHPRRNQITQCIGCHDGRPQIAMGPATLLEERDVLLLCSDGLWDPVNEQQMMHLLERGTLEEATNAMAEEAEAGAYPRSDNVSVVAFRLLANTSDRRRRPIKLVQPERPSKEKVEKAIDHIQKMIEEYEKEINRS